jgi:hypothetical protein
MMMGAVRGVNLTLDAPSFLSSYPRKGGPRAGQLSAADVQVVSEWIRLNEAVLVGY